MPKTFLLLYQAARCQSHHLENCWKLKRTDKTERALSACFVNRRYYACESQKVKKRRALLSGRILHER